MLDPEIIASIYEAIAEADVLAALCAIVCRAVNVDSAGLWLKRDGAFVALAVTPDIGESAGPYLAYYRHLDPWTAPFEAKRDRVVIGHENVSERELLASEFYNDFARGFGILRPMAINTDLAPGLTLSISTNRTTRHGLLDVGDKPSLAAVADHVRRALRTRERLGLPFAGQSDRSGHVAALDALTCGIVVCDGHGRVLHLNAAATALSGRGALTVRGRPPRLGATVRAEDEALVRLVFEAASGRGGGGTRLTDRIGRSVSALVTPLPPAIDDGFGAAKVLVALRDEDAVPSPDSSMLRALYGLSPAQADLCLGVAAGLTFDEMAAQRGVAVSTLRTHLAAVLARTGTRNLRDLIRLLGTLPPTA